ncbi:DUF4118 domain-containing protein [Cellulomonas fimi]|uniref:DUF4118 domain-containing protein n=1 Tax=Cellulomonas fimi TaxID=1708 RepID=UPI0023584F1C|nr:DUF4118 domain-containing protein [Cellulomonas fimi]
MTWAVIESHRWVVFAYAVTAPLVAAAAMGALREQVAPSTAVLVLVLVVVAAAATGSRAAGVGAALSAGLWFDYFLTEPYTSLAITSAEDVTVAILLLVVGVAVSELALWGRRQEARASRRAGYLDGVLTVTDVAALRSGPTAALLDDVAHRMTDLLGADGCRFRARSEPLPPSATTLRHDGTVTRDGRPFDVERHGLPTDDTITLEVRTRESTAGCFLITASTRIARPTLEQRRVAVLLADLVAPEV